MSFARIQNTAQYSFASFFLFIFFFFIKVIYRKRKDYSVISNYNIYIKSRAHLQERNADIIHPKKTLGFLHPNILHV
jgi:hypothetical protein